MVEEPEKEQCMYTEVCAAPSMWLLQGLSLMSNSGVQHYIFHYFVFEFFSFPEHVLCHIFLETGEIGYSYLNKGLNLYLYPNLPKLSN